MKTIQLLILPLFIALVASCSSDSGAPSAKEEQLVKLQNNGKAWVVNSSSQSSVFKDGYDVTSQFAGFSLEFGEFTYNTTNGLPHVWPTSGTWSFENDNASKIIRDDGVQINVNQTGNQLTLNFIAAGVGTGGRTKSLEGQYQFSLFSE